MNAGTDYGRGPTVRETHDDLLRKEALELLAAQRKRELDNKLVLLTLAAICCLIFAVATVIGIGITFGPLAGLVTIAGFASIAGAQLIRFAGKVGK